MLDRPEEMPAAFRDAWAARDAGRLGALFAADADFVNVVGLWWRDRATIIRAHDYGFRAIFPDSRLRLGRTACRRIGDDAAVIHARVTLHGQTAPDGGTAEPRRTILVFVMARRDAGWICVAAQNTDIHEGAETMLAREGELSPRDYR